MYYDQQLQEMQHLSQWSEPQKKNDTKEHFYLCPVPFVEGRDKYDITVLLTCVFKILNLPHLSPKLIHD